jgi:hypothetical protein
MLTPYCELAECSTSAVLLGAAKDHKADLQIDVFRARFLSELGCRWLTDRAQAGSRIPAAGIASDELRKDRSPSIGIRTAYHLFWPQSAGCHPSANPVHRTRLSKYETGSGRYG